MRKFLKLMTFFVGILAIGFAFAAGQKALPGDAGFAVYNYTGDEYIIQYTFDYDKSSYAKGLGSPDYPNTQSLPIISPNNYINLTQIKDITPGPNYGKIVEQGGWFSQGSYAIYPPQYPGQPIRFVKIR